MKRLLFIELNEVNFSYVEKYIALGKLEGFKKILSKYRLSKTSVEVDYSACEPWIQWVSARTGKAFEEHRVFRLGDIVNTSEVQVWEKLERDRGLRVGAISPINGRNSLRNPLYFIPDPWTKTKVSGGFLDRKLSASIAQIVNDNAHHRVELRSLFFLFVGFLKYSRFINYIEYFKILSCLRSKKWNKAMFLDLLLADMHICKVKKLRPDFSTLFLNSAAHIQHHYLFSSEVYEGKNYNPEWYVPRGKDPLLDVYKLYERIICQTLRELEKGGDLMLATGLHQDPCCENIFYYRLKDYESFFEEVKVDFLRIEARMSRDFLMVFKDSARALDAERAISSLVASASGDQVFSVDNRGDSLFVTLVYGKEIVENFKIHNDESTVYNFEKYCSFVAIKNGIHNSEGYFLDTTCQGGDCSDSFPLEHVSEKILNYFS
ncbi:hypothetical protein BMS_0339 [Halobacteriovorax marinus SJ]|uniref:Uncharacterized protein n=1 Tax=Halobacteriovorax marinus (strain ATCC BAA-682 / DSM 15412 / SJ) TaxID=862908 RepID=E1X3G7_HALMS|nr:hypothetical protein [Halobacteriovorax marinus]CBW25262.1 hypothetical protein BMS_0339 [Halobacteriovorax marinus SJ]